MMVRIFIIFVMLILADRDTYPINVASDCASAKLLQSEINTEFTMLTEQFKPIKDYESLYEISNLGRVKSLKRYRVYKKKSGALHKERILKAWVNSDGYFTVSLCKDSKTKSCGMHCLVWDAFGDKPRDGYKLQVDHKDEDKLNNRIDNLQLLTHRQNISKSYQTKRELPTGVWLNKKRYIARIKINGKTKYLGSFKCSTGAGLAYEKALKIINRSL